MNAPLVLALILSLFASNLGQTPAPAPQQQQANDDEVVRITSNLVQIDAVVTKDGRQVTDLKAEDFEIFEDGRPQTITNFSYISNTPAAAAVPSPNTADERATKDSNAPPVLPLAPVRPGEAKRTIALVVDDLGLSFESMSQMKRLLRKFVDEQVQTGDLVAIIRTGSDLGALQQFTNDKRLLYSAIERVRWNICSRAGISATPASRQGIIEQNVFRCGVNSSVDQSLKALRFIVQGMRALPGRKSMVILSDSIPVESHELEDRSFSVSRPTREIEIAQQREAMGSDSADYVEPLQRLGELAIRSSVVIYGIDSRGVVYPGATAADDFSGISWEKRDQILRARAASVARGREGTSSLARQTGGMMFQGTNDLASGLRRMMEDQKGYYLIGYRPSSETFNRRFHSIKARVKRSGLTVRTRAGFFGFTDADARAAQLTPRDRTLLALMSPFGGGDINVRLTALFANASARGSFLRSFLYLDARNLTFTDEPDGWHKTTFELTGVIFGDNGKVVNQHSQTETLRLRGQAYERILRDGLVYNFDMPVKKSGAYQFRVAVRDITSTHLGAAGQFVEIPDIGNDQLALSGIILSASNGSHNEQTKTVDDDTSTSPGVRRFRRLSNLTFSYVIYNAQIDNATKLAQLTAQVRIFRDGKPVYVGNAMSLDLTGQTDLRRIHIGSSLQLGADFLPGEYVLQIIVNDIHAKEKRRTVTQWIDFEVAQ